MSIKLRPVLIFLVCTALAEPVIAENQSGTRQTIVRAFQGVHRFNYLFVENGVPYLDEFSHLQIIEIKENKEEQITRVLFFNQTKTGKNLHFSYMVRTDGNNVTLSEFDSRGKQRFDCVGTYQPDKGLLECIARGAPKPARDLDSPLTRKIGLFKRPTSWPDYEVLDRHNLFRFYDWGFVQVQENLKLDADRKTVARETGVITALKIKP